MADQEEDFSSLPLPDRWVHKIWKVRKQAYEDAAKQFEKTASEQDPAFRPFLQDSGLFKSAVADSNVAAQQDGIAAYCAFLKFGGREHSARTRGLTVTPLCEKGLSSSRAATKTHSLEALLLLIELDVPGPVIDDVLPVLSVKQPKVIAATLNALTAIFHNYGCKTVDPKPVLKALPKMFGHADKNVRAEATHLAVEFYRWLREAMKPMFWADLKPTQQSDLEAQFEKIKAEGPPKQERLLRSQQEAEARAPAGGAGGGDGGDDGSLGEEPEEIDAFDLAEPQDILKGIPGDFYDNIASSKWKERKEALDALHTLVNVPRIKDGDFNELNRVLAKCMKDANVAVVTEAAQCIELLAKGMRKAYAKHRQTVMQPIMERLKEKKQSVADALGAALDAIFQATGLPECLEDITAFLVHKNPQVKEGTLKFLVRCLRNTRDVPSKPELAQMVESAKKLLAESSAQLREGGAEVLGTIMKIIGERAMNPHLEGLDDIRKTKVKEFYETAEVKAKEKPKARPPAARAPGAGGAAGAGGGPPKKVVGGGRKGPVGLRKAGPGATAPPPAAEPTPQPTTRPPGAKLGMPKPSGIGGLKAPQRRGIPGPGGASPRRPVSQPPPAAEQEEEPPATVSPPRPPRLGMGRGGLAARSLAKPSAAPAAPAPAPERPPSTGLTALERAELEELRAANDRLMRQAEDFRHEKSKLMSEIQELKNQNAGLIEDHTRDVLSIKAKETQLVRARSDAEAAESTNERLRRELDRLKRALGKAEALGMQQDMLIGSPNSAHGLSSPTGDDMGIFRDGPSAGGYGRPASATRNRISYASTMSEEKENGDALSANGGGGAVGGSAVSGYPRSKLSPELRYNTGSSASSGRGSPARGYRGDAMGGMGGLGGMGTTGASHLGGGNHAPSGAESWKRAAEVTSQLKARIELMKAKQGSFARQ